MTNIELGGKSYSPEEMAVLAKAGVLSVGQKNDPASSTPTSTPLHGPFPGNVNQFGIFSDGRVNPDRYSAMQRPSSLLSLLPLVRSEVYNEIFEIVTGQTAGGTTNATDFCGNPPEVGQLKTCQQLLKFGSYFTKTKLNSLPYVGMRRDNADVPAQIMNAAPNQRNRFIPDVMYQLGDTRSQLALEMYNVGVDLERTSTVVAWQGQQGVDNSRTGWFSEFDGLSQLIKTGYTDVAAAGTPACPAADSIVDTFAADISSSDSNGRDIVEALTDQFYAAKDRAAQTGMDGTVFTLVMRSEMFRRLTDVWACSYATYRCDGSTSSPNNRDGMEIQRLRTEMFGGQYLLIDGMQVPVVLDAGIPLQRTANNLYTSDIFIVPLSYAGMPLTYVQYFPMNNAYAQQFASFQGEALTYLNDGLYAVTNRNDGFCKEYLFAAQMRMILRTPFLAARLDDVSFTYLAKTRSALPGDTALYANGGVTFRS